MKKKSIESNPYDLRNTRLYELLNFLTLKQREKLIELLQLDIFLLNKEVFTLLENITFHIDNEPNTPLYREQLIASTNRHITEKNFNYVTGYLVQKICQVLRTLNILKGYEQEYNSILLNFFHEKGMEKNFSQVSKDINKTLPKKRTHSYHYHLFKYHELRVIRNKNDRKPNNEFTSMVDHLESFYAENKLRLLCEEINRGNIHQQSKILFLDNKDREHFLYRVERSNFFQSISVEIYFHIYKMLYNKTQQNYQTVSSLVEKYSFVPNVEATFIQYMMNQCMYFITVNIQQEEYAQAYIVHLSRLEKIKELLDGNGKLLLGFFQNRVLSGLILKQESETRAFIKKNVRQLMTSNKNFMKHLHLALLEFEIGNFSVAEEYICKIDTDKILDKKYTYFVISYYKVSMQIFHARKKITKAVNKAEALRKYIERQFNNQQSISPEKYNILKKFVSYFQRIVDTPKLSHKWDDLCECFFEERSQIAYANWLETLIENKKVT